MTPAENLGKLGSLVSTIPSIVSSARLAVTLTASEWLRSSAVASYLQLVGQHTIVVRQKHRKPGNLISKSKGCMDCTRTAQLILLCMLGPCASCRVNSWQPGIG